MPGPRQPDAGNYLRMRGEEMLIARIDRRRMELPPHARRRAIWPWSFPTMNGITSACAEKR